MMHIAFRSNDGNVAAFSGKLECHVTPCPMSPPVIQSRIELLYAGLIGASARNGASGRPLNNRLRSDTDTRLPRIRASAGGMTGISGNPNHASAKINFGHQD